MGQEGLLMLKEQLAFHELISKAEKGETVAAEFVGCC